jgi:hypothetical protein
VVLAVALGQASAFLLLYMPSLWLSLEAGVAALATAVFILLILADVIVEVVTLAKAYLAAGAVAGLLAGALLAVVVVVTAVPEVVPEIAREAGVSVEEARILYSALFGAAVGVGFAMFISLGFLRRFCGGFLSLGLICRVLCFSSRRGFWPPPSSSPSPSSKQSQKTWR